MGAWETAQEWESSWWGDCLLTFGEETKQLTYADRMGIAVGADDGKWPTYDLAGASVVDIGGGPVSMLLKARNYPNAHVVDPCRFPLWVVDRYSAAGVEFLRLPAENLTPAHAPDTDECWLYNVLQHTEDPERVIAAAREVAPRLRVFEWVETEINVGHPHSFTKKELDALFNADGKVEFLDGENALHGIAYYGVFG